MHEVIVGVVFFLMILGPCALAMRPDNSGDGY
jgi:hypothetical protein